MIEQRAFTFPFEEKDWGNKLLIGSLFYLIAPFLLGVPLLISQGYSLRVWRDAAAGRSPRLPAWDDWGEMGLRGLVYSVVVFLYSLPLWLLSAVTLAIAVGGGLGLAWMGSGMEAGEALAGWLTIAALLLAAILGFMALVSLALTVFIGLLVPVAVSRYVETGRLNAALELGVVWRVAWANLGGLVVAWLVFLVAGLVLGGVVGVVGAVPCFGGLFVYLFTAPLMFYLSLAQAWLMGRAYHEAQRRLGDAAAVSIETSSAESAAAAPRPVEAGIEVATVEPASDRAAIETLGLSERVLRALRGAGVATIGQLVERLAQGDEALLSIRGVGDKALAEIKAQLTARGYLDV